jgi:hypothetical protein
MKSGNLNSLEPSGPLQACNGIDLPLLYIVMMMMVVVVMVMTIMGSIRHK